MITLAQELRRRTGVPLGDFLEVPTRICIGGGLEKVDAIHGMLQGRYANVLITDEQTAQSLLTR